MQPASDDVNALHFAAQKGHLEVCRALLNAGEPVRMESVLCSRPSCTSDWANTSLIDPISGLPVPAHSVVVIHGAEDSHSTFSACWMQGPR